MPTGKTAVEESQHLVEDASRGEPGAIDALLARHLPGLRRYVGHRAGREVLERESESDVVQSVCRELFEGLRDERFEYRGEREFKRWLYAAALFKLQVRRRHWRTLKRGGVAEARIDAPSGAVGAVPEPVSPTTPSVEASRGEDVARLRAALAALPENYREVVELAHLEGLSHREIGERLGIAEGHSRVLLTRALARLAALGARRRG